MEKRKIEKKKKSQQNQNLVLQKDQQNSQTVTWAD